MFLQDAKGLAQVYDQNIENQHEYIKDTKNVSQKLSEKASEMQGVTPYRTIVMSLPSALCLLPAQRVQSLNANEALFMPLSCRSEWWLPWCHRAICPFIQWILCLLECRSGERHIMVILRSRNKITYFLMILAWASPFKRMPFAFLVEDHSVYVRITLLKAENLASIVRPLLVPSIRSVWWWVLSTNATRIVS